MLAVGPLGPQYSLLFAWHELGSGPICDTCPYSCAQSSKLSRHMRIHVKSGVGLYKCSFCDMPFTVATTLEKHVRKCSVNKYLMSSTFK